MSDTQDQPSRDERDQIADRITRAAAAGWMSTADRDIRLGNARMAQSRAELDLMSRDLEQLETAMAGSAAASRGPGFVAALGPGRPSASGHRAEALYHRFDPGQVSSGDGSKVVGGGSRRGLTVTMSVTVAALFVAGVIAFIALIGHRVASSSAPSVLPPAQTDDTTRTEPSGASSTAPRVPSGDYGLTTKGLTAFLATYATKFGTTKVVDLVLYPQYAVVDVPVAGGRGRQAGWLYRKDSGWTSFGGVRAVFPGATTIDTTRLNVAALVRNVARARRTLNVEDPGITYVVLRFVPPSDRVAGVDIHVSNRFSESGYLATRLDGSIDRAYPFGG